MQNAQSCSYPKFQIILCKTVIAPKGFCLEQARLKWHFGQKKGSWAMACNLFIYLEEFFCMDKFKIIKSKIIHQSTPKSFFNIWWDAQQKIFFFGLSLLCSNERTTYHIPNKERETLRKCKKVVPICFSCQTYFVVVAYYSLLE